MKKAPLINPVATRSIWFTPLSEVDADKLTGAWTDTSAIIGNELQELAVRGWLPEAVMLAQFAAVPPLAHNIELSVPIVIRTNTPERDQLLRAYGLTVHSILADKISFHLKATHELTGHAGTVLILSQNDTGLSGPNLPEVNRIQVNYQFLVAPDLECLAALETPSRTDAPEWEQVDFLGWLHSPENQSAFLKLGNLLREKLGFRHSQKPYSAVNLPEDDVQRLASFTKDLLDQKYLRFIASSVAYGSVVLVSARQFGLAKVRDREQVGDSGLTLVFRPRHNVTDDDMERCYAVASKLNGLFAAAHGVARRIADRAKLLANANAVRLMEHSLGNTLGELGLTCSAAKPHLELEEAMLKACRALGSDAIVVFEPFPQTALQAALFDRKPKLRLDTGFLSGSTMDPRLIAIVIELCRNLKKHSAAAEEGSLKISIGPLDRPDIRVAGRATASHARKLLGRLSENLSSSSASLRGVPSLVLLASGIAGDGACAEWSFVRFDGVSDEDKTWGRNENGLTLKARGPKWLFENVAPPTSKLHFAFSLSGLKPGLIRL